MLWECLVWPGGREVWAGTARPVCRTVWRCWPRAGSGTATPPGRDGPSSRPQVSPQCGEISRLFGEISHLFGEISPQCGEISRLQRSSSPLPSPARVWCWTVCVSSWSTVRPYIVIWKGISVFILFIDYNRLLILNVIVVVKCNIPVKLLYNALTIDALQANCLVTLMFTISVIKQLLCCTDAGRITFPSHSFYFYFIDIFIRITTNPPVLRLAVTCSNQRVRSVTIGNWSRSWWLSNLWSSLHYSTVYSALPLYHLFSNKVVQRKSRYKVTQYTYITSMDRNNIFFS